MARKEKSMRQLINEVENFDATQYLEKENQLKSDMETEPKSVMQHWEDNKNANTFDNPITITFEKKELEGILEALATTNIENLVSQRNDFQGAGGEKYQNYKAGEQKIKNALYNKNEEI